MTTIADIVSKLESRRKSHEEYYDKKNEVAQSKRGSYSLSMKLPKGLDNSYVAKSIPSWGLSALKEYASSLQLDALSNDVTRGVSLDARRLGFYDMAHQAIRQSLISGVSFFVRIGSTVVLRPSSQVSMLTNARGEVIACSACIDGMSLEVIGSQEIQTISEVIYISQCDTLLALSTGGLMGEIVEVGDSLKLSHLDSSSLLDSIDLLDSQESQYYKSLDLLTSNDTNFDTSTINALDNSSVFIDSVDSHFPSVDMIHDFSTSGSNHIKVPEKIDLSSSLDDLSAFLRVKRLKDGRPSVSTRQAQQAHAFTVNNSSSIFSVCPISPTFSDSSYDTGAIGRSLFSRAFCEAVKSGALASQLVKQAGVLASYNQNLLILQGVKRLERDSRTKEIRDSVSENVSNQQSIPTIEIDSLQGEITLEKLAAPSAETAEGVYKSEAATAASSVLLPTSALGVLEVQLSGDFLAQQRHGFKKQIEEMRESLSNTLVIALSIFMDAHGFDVDDYCTSRVFYFKDTMNVDSMAAFADGVYKLKEILGDSISSDALARRAGFSEFDRIKAYHNSQA